MSVTVFAMIAVWSNVIIVIVSVVLVSNHSNLLCLYCVIETHLRNDVLSPGFSLEGCCILKECKDQWICSYHKILQTFVHSNHFKDNVLVSIKELSSFVLIKPLFNV